MVYVVWWDYGRHIWSTSIRWFRGVSIISQIIGTVLGIVIALAGGFNVYGILKVTMGIRLSRE